MHFTSQRLLGDIPFIWDYSAQCGDAHGLPDRMPFTVGVDPTCGALVQVADEAIRRALLAAYEFGSVMAGVDTPDVKASSSYAEAFWRFVRASLGAEVATSRCLDIGSGHGALLSRLHGAGADAIGLEPGEHGQTFARASGITVVRDFFPSERVEGAFDAILACHVLEHIEDTHTFLTTVRRLLKPRGQFLIAVPDCSPYIAAGDPSMFVHEHFFYHTRHTVERMLHAHGMTDIEISTASYGGSLYARCRAGSIMAHDKFEPRETALETFDRAYDRNTKKAVAVMRKLLASGGDVGFYMPIRALNLLALSGLPTDKIRFFDDDANMHGKRLVDFPISVESRAQLFAAPPAHLIIMSHTFGSKLRAELEPLLPSSTSLLTWNDVIANPQPQEHPE